MSHSQLSLHQIQQQKQPAIQLMQSNRQLTPLPKFIKTNHQIDQHLIPQNNHHQKDECTAILESNGVAKSILEEIIEKVQNMINIKLMMAPKAIKQTLSIIINDPNIGILGCKQPLNYHQQTTLQKDSQPKSYVVIEGGRGMAKVENHDNKTSFQSQDSGYMKKSVGKYYRYDTKVSHKLIGYDKAKNHIPQKLKSFKNIQKEQNSKSNKRNGQNKSRQQANRNKKVEQPLQQSKLISLFTEPEQADEGMTNYLRFIKQEQENAAIKAKKQAELNMREIETTPITNKELGIQRERTQKMVSNKSSKASNQGNAYNKCIMTYQQCISVGEGNKIDNNYSLDDDQNIDRSIKCLQNAGTTKTLNSKSLYQTQPRKTSKVAKTNANQSLISENFSTINQNNESMAMNRLSSKAVSLPILNPMKNSQHQQSTNIYEQQKQKMKEFQGKLAMFLNRNASKSHIIIKEKDINIIDKTTDQKSNRKNQSGYIPHQTNADQKPPTSKYRKTNVNPSTKLIKRINGSQWKQLRENKDQQNKKQSIRQSNRNNINLPHIRQATRNSIL